MQIPFHFYLFAAWSAYCIIHSVLASVWCKQFIQQRLPDFFPYYRLMYSFIAVLTLTGLLYYQFNHNSFNLFYPHWYIVIPALMIACAGFLVMILSGRKYLLMISGASVFKKEATENKLEQGGLHSYVRHPVYSGTIVTLWSLFLIFPLMSNLIACLVISIYTLIGIGFEERKLIMEFGEHYINYSRKTPMLFPVIGKRAG